MNYLFSILLLVFTSSGIYSQTLILSGEQIKSKTDKKTQLVCEELKLDSSYVISKVEGNCASFWIQKGNITIHKFNKLEKCIGVVLKPGKYSVYPDLKVKQNKSKIKLTLTKKT